MAETELKPCPFCGSEAGVLIVPKHEHILATWMPDYEGGVFIECNNCTCMISGANIEDATEQWNRRM